MSEVWKKFDEIELTHSSTHHLLAINSLINEYGYARSVDIANHLSISRASASITLSKLKERGFVVEDKNRFLKLSEKGQNIVDAVTSKKRIVKQFFTDVLNMDDDDAEVEACKIEHLLTENSGKKLMSFLGFYLSDNTSAKKFRSEFTKFSYSCSSTQECAWCEEECYYSRHGES